MSVECTQKITYAIQTSDSDESTRYVQHRYGRLTPIVAIKNPARWESHPNISEDRQGTEDTIISWERQCVIEKGCVCVRWVGGEVKRRSGEGQGERIIEEWDEVEIS
jgi:hypothetical protein